MNKALLIVGIVTGLSSCAVSAQTSSLTGTVERVWEDGFLINAGDRPTRVDAWDVCGDNTQQYIFVGNELTIEGEFSGGEFDASAITNTDGDKVCSSTEQ